MDFITGFPRSRRQHDSILVIVEKITKSAHFLLVKITYLAKDYTKLYNQEVVRFHGVPVSIISDRCAQFNAQFLKSVQKCLGSRLDLSTAFHPHTDGQAYCSIPKLRRNVESLCNKFQGKIGMIKYPSLSLLTKIIIIPTSKWLHMKLSMGECANLLLGGLHFAKHG